MKFTTLTLLLSLLVLTSCSSIKPESFSNTAPNLDPVQFFGGHTHSAGVLEARSGKPSERITTKTVGAYADGVLSMKQDLFQENKNPTHRNFRLKLTDPHHVEGTGSDIVGTAHGHLYGNYFTWSFQLKIADKGLVKKVNMTQHMYLMPDGKTLIIRSIIRKFGIIVKEITEQFHKEE